MGRLRDAAGGGVTDRPILFSAPMVRALLDGRKTQTRRVLKPLSGLKIETLVRDGEHSTEGGILGGGVIRCARHQVQEPRFAAGDCLWVKETWACHWATDNQKPSEIDPQLWSVRYFADDTVRPALRGDSVAHVDQCRKKRVAIFMPRWASRITLLVTDVRVQRLQDISETDAIAEGAFKGKATGRVFNSATAMRLGGDEWRNARDWYADLWETINVAGAWDENPWVVAVSFIVEQRNIDA
jgi:hypothetical protein